MQIKGEQPRGDGHEARNDERKSKLLEGGWKFDGMDGAIGWERRKMNVGGKKKSEGKRQKGVFMFELRPSSWVPSCLGKVALHIVWFGPN